MRKKSNHSQDYDRKHGNEHNVKDKAALKEDYINHKRKDASEEDTNDFNKLPLVESKDAVPLPEHVAVDRPGFDLGGSTGKTSAGTGLGLGLDAFENRRDRSLRGRRGKSK